MPSSELDNESRANRFMNAMDCVGDLLTNASMEMSPKPEYLGSLIDMLSTEAKAILLPRIDRWMNDNDCD